MSYGDEKLNFGLYCSRFVEQHCTSKMHAKRPTTSPRSLITALHRVHRSRAEIEASLSTLLSGQHAETAALLADVSTAQPTADAAFHPSLFEAAEGEVELDNLGFWLDPLGEL